MESISLTKIPHYDNFYEVCLWLHHNTEIKQYKIESLSDYKQTFYRNQKEISQDEMKIVIRDCGLSLISKLIFKIHNSGMSFNDKSLYINQLHQLRLKLRKNKYRQQLIPVMAQLLFDSSCYIISRL